MKLLAYVGCIVILLISGSGSGFLVGICVNYDDSCSLWEIVACGKVVCLCQNGNIAEQEFISI